MTLSELEAERVRLYDKMAQFNAKAADTKVRIVEVEREIAKRLRGEA